MLDVPAKETAKAAAAFDEYCAMGPGRSLAKLANRGQIEGKPWVRLPTLEQWSSQHRWQERVKEYDAEQIEKERIERKARIDEADRRQAAESKEDADMAREELRSLATKHKLGSMAAVTWLKNSREAERKALGSDDAELRKLLQEKINAYLEQDNMDDLSIDDLRQIVTAVKVYQEYKQRGIPNEAPAETIDAQL